MMRCGALVILGQVPVSARQSTADNWRVGVEKCPNEHCWNRSPVLAQHYVAMHAAGCGRAHWTERVTTIEGSQK
jgi:hypothetical protein